MASTSQQLRRFANRIRELTNASDPEHVSIEQIEIADGLNELAAQTEAKWELVCPSSLVQETRGDIMRLRVPGGWIYRCESSIQFVPDPPEGVGSQIDVGDRVLAKVMDDRGQSTFEELRVMRATSGGVHMETADGHQLTLAIKCRGA